MQQANFFIIIYVVFSAKLSCTAQVYEFQATSYSCAHETCRKGEPET
jgi:hypothetical protein